MKPEFRMVRTDNIAPNPNQTREKPDEDTINAIVNSWGYTEGIIQPLSLCPNKNGKSNKEYRIVDGEERLLSAIKKGEKEVPTILYPEDPKGKGHYAKTVLANELSKKLEPPERARAFIKLRQQYNLSEKELAELLNLSVDRIKQIESPEQLPVTTLEKIQELGIKDTNVHNQVTKIDQKYHDHYLKKVKETGRHKTEKLIPILKSDKASEELKQAVLKTDSKINRKTADQIQKVDKKTQTKLINRIEETGQDAEQTVSILKSKDASQELKNAVIQKGSKLTPEMAEIIQEADQEHQSYLVEQAKKYSASDSKAKTISKLEEAVKRTKEPREVVTDIEKKILKNIQKDGEKIVEHAYWKKQSQHLSDKGKQLFIAELKNIRDYLDRQLQEAGEMQEAIEV